MKHFAHYLTREVKKSKKIEIPFFAQEQNPSEGFKRPMFHITKRKTGPVLEIENGSIIWLFSILKSPWGNLPPSLDAKFIVEKVEHLTNGETKFYANEQSHWYPLFDATQVLKTLITVDKNKKQNKLWANPLKPLGFYLQSIRQLNNGEELLNYSNSIDDKKFDFISYRIKDGTKPAFKKVEDLIKNGGIVFWDKHCLPRRMVERREHVDDAELDEYLSNKIRESKQVFGIETPMYRKIDGYAYREFTLANELNKYVSSTPESY